MRLDCDCKSIAARSIVFSNLEEEEEGKTGERILACPRGTAGRQHSTRRHAPSTRLLCKSLLVARHWAGTANTALA